MIAWDSFVRYLWSPGTNMKVFVGLILAAAFFLRRRQLLRKPSETLFPFALPALLIAAFSVRLAWILYSQHEPPAPITEDLLIFHHAKDLMAGNGFRNYWTGEFTAFRPVGYPLVMAGLFKIFGIHLFIIEFFQVILTTATVAVIYKIGKQTVSKVFGFVAAAFFAFDPTAIMSTKILLDEHPFLLLWLGALSVLISDYQKPTFRKVAWAALLVGLSAVCRTYSIITCGIVFFAWLFGKRAWGAALLRATVVAILTLLCAAPWAVRNSIRLGAPIFWTSAIGTNFYFANNSTSDVSYPVNPDLAHGGDPDFLNPRNTELQTNIAGRRAAQKWIAENPWKFADKATGRAFYMLGLDKEGWVIDDNFTHLREGAKPPSPRTLKRLSKLENFYYGTLFLLTLVGSFFFLRDFEKEKASGFLYLFISLWFYVVSTAVALAHRKYRFPLDPFFCWMSTYALWKLIFLPQRVR